MASPFRMFYRQRRPPLDYITANHNNGYWSTFPATKRNVSYSKVYTTNRSNQNRSDRNFVLQPIRTFSLSSSLQNNLWPVTDSVMDPMNVLDEVTEVPLVPPSDKLFNPSSEDIASAQHYFKEASKTNSIIQDKGVVNLSKLPVTSYPEIAFLGRSNVGKSSLINSILRSPKVKATVSRRPGHTRTLKFYHISRSFSLVDMPGYGYNMLEYFVESMEEYLKNRKQLLKVFLLIDGKVGFTSTDHIAIEMMEEFSKPYVIAFTKIDKAQPSYVIKHIVKMQNSPLSCCFPQPLLTSSTNHWGIGLLQSFITYITGAQTFASIR